MKYFGYGKCYKACKVVDMGNGNSIYCAYCHIDEMPAICHGTTASGETCQREINVKSSNYCNWHLNEANIDRLNVSMEQAWKMAEQSVKKELNMTMALYRDVLHEKIEQKVYFIRDGGRYVKIGTSKKPYERLEMLRRKADSTLRPDDLYIDGLYVSWLVKGGRDVESMFHSKLHENHVIGEWFAWDDRVLDAIREYERVILK